MRIERWGIALWLLSTAVIPLHAQDPLSRVGPKTQVKSVEFRFTGKHSLPEEDLRTKIALSGQGGMVGLRRTLGFLPFVPPVGSHLFDPLEMQRDVVRLRNYYKRSGFPKADIRHEARYNAKSDLIRVTYVVAEGPPLLVHSVRFVGDSGTLKFPPELAPQWDQFVKREQRNAGHFGENEERALADSTTRWFRDRGYPFAAARLRGVTDSAANRADVTVLVRPGMRARIRSIVVSGNGNIPAHQITRQLTVKPGDWYNLEELEKGRQQLVQLDLVRLALFEVPRDSADDSTVVVDLDVTMNQPHLVRGEAGLASAGGVSGEVTWTHRSFLRGVRTFTVTGTAQTGALSFEDPAQQLYRASATLFLPYIGNRRLSLALGPYLEYRNDIRDRSRAGGLEASLAYAVGPLRSIALGYTISHREILAYGYGQNLDPVQYLPLLGLADSNASSGRCETEARSVCKGPMAASISWPIRARATSFARGSR
jgi:outer membrane protein assembly factor BamA